MDKLKKPIALVVTNNLPHTYTNKYTYTYKQTNIQTYMIGVNEFPINLSTKQNY